MGFGMVISEFRSSYRISVDPVVRIFWEASILHSTIKAFLICRNMYEHCCPLWVHSQNWYWVGVVWGAQYQGSASIQVSNSVWMQTLNCRKTAETKFFKPLHPCVSPLIITEADRAYSFHALCSMLNNFRIFYKFQLRFQEPLFIVQPLKLTRNDSWYAVRSP